jgi:predicted nucleic acid-binding protein
MKPTVYIETTVISYLTARPSRDLVRAAQQQITREWWDQRGRYELFVSELVLAEASVGDATAAADRLGATEGLAVLRISLQADALAEALVSKLAIPPSALRDAVHVAVCAANGLEYLLTWNCRHLANLHQRAKIEQVCREAGFVPPIIGTPNELLEEAS